jgi:ParB-like nuclease domain
MKKKQRKPAPAPEAPEPISVVSEVSGAPAPPAAPQDGMKIEYWPIDRFVHYARNPRKDDAAVDRMVSSLKEFGFAIPVLARSDGTVVDGHLRLKGSAKAETWPGGDTSRIPLILCDSWTEAQVKAFRLLANRSVAWAEWDQELLGTELLDLKALDFDLGLTGFDPTEVTGFIMEAEKLPPGADEDETPEPPTNPVTVLGDLWVMGNEPSSHRALCGDSTQLDAVERLMGDQSGLGVYRSAVRSSSCQ